MADCKLTLSSWNLRIPWKNNDTSSCNKKNNISGWKNYSTSVWKNKGIAAWKIAKLSRGQITKTPGGNVYLWAL
eukprot:7927877-Heterocapsa_arctica.AAC.1